MSDTIPTAVAALNARIGDTALEGCAKFIVKGQGAILIDENGARAADGEADVTLTADEDTFRAILEGDLAPTAAFMSGKLGVEGDMGVAMKLGAALA